MRRALPLILLLGIASAPLVAAVDPFYRARMENGYRAFDQGNWEEAGHQLRIACFGHLDEPPFGGPPENQMPVLPAPMKVSRVTISWAVLLS